jgi:hypothetical protein
VHAVSLDPATQTANYSAQFVETNILKVRVRLRVCACVRCYVIEMYLCWCAISGDRETRRRERESCVMVDEQGLVRVLCLGLIVARTACNTRPPFCVKVWGEARREACPFSCSDAHGGLGSMAVPE